MTQQDTYAQAGVNIQEGNKATQLMKSAIRATYGPEVLSDTGSFGGLYAAHALQAMESPVLVASTDGVGTKTKVAARLNRWDSIGQDLVNHCINDILVQGARPLFFLDYVASSRLDAEKIATIVGGVAAACKSAGCALLGGETAEMPGVYEPGEIDLVGTVVGVVERASILDGSRIQQGDVILTLPSSGLHTNGFSLARQVLNDLDWTQPHPDLGESIGDALLAVHRCYFNPVNHLHEQGIDLRGLAHITGGGVTDNLPRILPENATAVIERGTWTEPPIFRLIQQLGEIEDEEMFHVFNMGLGMLIILPAAQLEQALTLEPELRPVGEITSGERSVAVKGQA
ncbi:MAG: phosphoribosylformylglycinamidine cyclo-ligase [Anaerolineae bacterium]|nr:phosphoribosylformylglycinamidine cyclo-ligase [Anaerolineae bacterium]